MVTLTLIGILILLVPFLFILKFKDKINGFTTILSFFLFFQLILALITQYFKIFNYLIILIVHLFFLVILFYKFKFEKKDFKINFRKIDWTLLILIFILLISLSFVHFNYSGKYNVVGNPQYLEAQNIVYPYPYFSDEWYAISLIDYSMMTDSLPTKSFLMQEDFLNLQLAFHSFLSLNFKLLNLEPLLNYVKFSIVINSLICILIYLFLKQNKINSLVSAITAISTIYITNGANLSGIWNLIPINLGILTFILAIFFFYNNNLKMILLTGLLTLLFYPPLSIFFVLMFLIYLFGNKNLKQKEKIKQTLFLFVICFISVIFLFFISFFFHNLNQGFFNYLISKLIYFQFTGEYVPQYKIFLIIPLWTILFSIFGLFSTFKDKKLILGVIIFSLFFWFFYSNTLIRIIIDYSRLVFFSSILITIFSGFGLQFILEKMEKLGLNKKIIKTLLVIFFLIFFISSFNYTKNETWVKLIAKNSQGNIVYPASPVNQYLTPEDFKIFNNLKNITFLSWPWKGTVIGVATKNIPLSTKAGTITIFPELFYEFMNSNCENKLNIVRERKIEYIYSPEFNCNGFEKQKISKENLVLYKVKY